MNIDESVRQYVACRDLIKLVEDRHKEKIAPLKEKLNRLAGQLESFLDSAGANVNSVNTTVGTFYRTTRYTASLADPALFMDFVRTTGQFELMDRKANSTAVKDYVTKNGHLPPGCNLSSISTIGVQRASNKAAGRLNLKEESE